MEAAIAHLPGCDLNHKPRQRCSTWVPLTPSNSVLTFEPMTFHSPSSSASVGGRYVAPPFVAPVFVVIAFGALAWTVLMMWWAVDTDENCGLLRCQEDKAAAFILLVFGWALIGAALVPVLVLLVTDQERRSSVAARIGYLMVALIPVALAFAWLLMRLSPDPALRG